MADSINRAVLAVCMTAALGWTALAQAQTGATLADDLAEGSRLATRIDAGVTYTDNFYYEPSDRPQLEAIGFQLRPEVGYNYALPRFRFLAQAEGELARFNVASDEDDYVDGRVGIGLDWMPAIRHRFGWSASFAWDHDPFHTERTEALTINGVTLANRELDKWRRQNFDIKYHYGQRATPFDVEARLATNEKTYATNRNDGVNSGTRFQDYDLVLGSLALLYNFSPKTAVLVGTSSTLIRFDNMRSNLSADGFFDPSADELRYHVGARWLATAKTTGDIRLGYVERSPRDRDLDDFSAFDWQATVGWTPTRSQLVSLQTGRRSQETYLEAVDFIDNRYVEASWAQDWNSVFNTRLSGGYIDSSFVGTARTDELVQVGLSAELRAARSLWLVASGNYTERETGSDERDYDKLNGYAGIRYSR